MEWKGDDSKTFTIKFAYDIIKNNMIRDPNDFFILI